MDFSNKSQEELLQLYNDAVEAYESGEQIMSDAEYDELVEYLRIEHYFGNTALILYRKFH